MTRPTLLVLVNGRVESAIARRAQSLTQPLHDRWKVTLLYREWSKIGSLRRFLRAILTARPDLVYVVDTAISGAGAALLAHLWRGQPFVVDTGDFAYDLAVSAGRPNWAGRQIIRGIEQASLKQAEAVVVRGTFHKQMLFADGLPTPVHVVQDGIGGRRGRADAAHALRQALGWSDDTLSVGMMGSLRWSLRRKTCYGWDLVEAMARLDAALPVRALIVGDGDGLTRIRRHADARGVAGRVHFAGRVPAADVAAYTGAMDVAVSTQTNDRVGWARTTGKLPEYMASGCFVLATDVGEATRLLPPEMLLPYHGAFDPHYPARLAQAIEALAARGRADVRAAGTALIDRAYQELDYACLSARLGAVLENTRCTIQK